MNRSFKMLVLTFKALSVPSGDFNPSVCSSTQTLCDSSYRSVHLYNSANGPGGLCCWLTMSVASGAVRVEAVTGSNAFIERLQSTLETGNTAEQLCSVTAPSVLHLRKKTTANFFCGSVVCVCVCERERECVSVWERESSAVSCLVTFTSLERFFPLCWTRSSLWEAFKRFPETSQLQARWTRDRSAARKTFPRELLWRHCERLQRQFAWGRYNITSLGTALKSPWTPLTSQITPIPSQRTPVISL